MKPHRHDQPMTTVRRLAVPHIQVKLACQQVNVAGATPSAIALRAAQG